MSEQQITRVDLNTIVKALAAKDRPGAVAILARYGALNTPGIKTDDIAAAHAEFVEALSRVAP